MTFADLEAMNMALVLSGKQAYEFPRLYKRSSKLKIETWIIYVKGNVIKTKYGELDGKQLVTTDEIKEGKNLGKKTQTTAAEQAFKEAQAKWEKKLKSGYIQNLNDAKKGKVDSIIKGGIEPMLAHKYSEHSAKIKFPCFVQPKLDGIRCIAIKENGKVTLWSRTRKQITSCPHIEVAIAAHFPDDIILDGELYNHDLRHDFEQIVSAVRKEEPSEKSKLIKFYAYDLVENDFHFRTRVEYLRTRNVFAPELVVLRTYMAQHSEEIKMYYDTCVQAGYEGAMVRNAEGVYENKRSYNLQKVKLFDDAEFEIIGITEGRGKLSGNLGTFICKDERGNKFEVKMSGSEEANKKFFQDKEGKTWKGKMLTVQFQGFTTTNRLPRFPVGLRIREDA